MTASRRLGRGIRLGKIEFEAEAAASTGRALDRDFPAHAAHQLAADGESEPGSAKAPMRVAHLLEWLEDRLVLIGCNADAVVFHFEAHQCVGALIHEACDPHDHAARWGRGEW